MVGIAPDWTRRLDDMQPGEAIRITTERTHNTVYRHVRKMNWPFNIRTVPNGFLIRRKPEHGDETTHSLTDEGIEQ